MSAFATALSGFCSGRVPLPELLSVLREDITRDRKSIVGHSSLVDRAWRSGLVDAAAYEALRNTITDFHADPHARRPSENQVSTVVATDPVYEAAPTLFRPHASQPGYPSGRTEASLPRSSSSSSGSASWADVPGVELKRGMVLKDRFLLEEEIGRGGMGTVFKARDHRKEEAQDRDPFVAVKVLNEGFRRHPESLKALQRESKKSQSLAHPNVASVFDFDRDGSTVFLVMELLEGPSLHSLIESRAGRGLPRGEVMRIIREAGAALAYAHKKGVIHSDFKPANVIRTFEGTVKVLDFGIARAFSPLGGTASKTTHFDVSALRAVTPAYASPEMLTGEPPDPRDDVFALGCVAYELLSGRHPFGYSTALSAERNDAKLVRIEQLPASKWRAIQHALAFSRAERTPSVEQFLLELEHGRKDPKTPIVFGAIAASVVLAAAGAFYFVRMNDDAQRATPPAQIAETTENIVTDEIATAPDRNPSAANAGASERPPDRSPSAASAGAQERPTEIIERPSAPVAAAERPATVASVAAPPPEPVKQAASPAPGPAEQPATIARTEPKRDVARRYEFSSAQLKERVISFARAGEVSDAIAALADYQTKTTPEDPGIREATIAIAEAYSRLAEKSFAEGDFTSAVSLATRASEFAPDLALALERRQEMERAVDLVTELERGDSLSVERLQDELARLRASIGSNYYRVRRQLASILVKRIEAERASAPANATALIHVAQELFPGVPAVDALEATPAPATAQ